MWTNTKYPELAEARKRQAPTDDGEPLLVIPRGEREELRVMLKDYQGHPYVSLRIWEADDHGQKWPVRGKGLSVRVGEASAVAAALRSAATNVVGTDGDSSNQRQGGSSRVAQRRGQGRGEQARPTKRVETPPEFNEFE